MKEGAKSLDGWSAEWKDGMSDKNIRVQESSIKHTQLVIFFFLHNYN
jgi:hypothetical protein